MRRGALTRAVLVWTCVVGSGGCTSLYSGYEGQTDYRKAALSEATGRLVPLSKKYSPTDDGAGPIKAGETVSVHLTQAFLKSFHEGWEGWWNPFVPKRGEIAIVARCFEATAGGIDFDPAAVRSGGRVVFYTEDAREDTFLNFSNVMIYGPAVYGGHPLVIELCVIELDEAEGVKAKQLITKLADIGAAAQASAGPALKLLDDLGGTLLSGNRDDMEMRYVFVLDPSESTDGWRHGALERNHYVLMRRDVKRSPESTYSAGLLATDNTATGEYWENLQLDQEQGRVVRVGETTSLYRETTYLVVRIDAGMAELQDGTAQTLDALQKSLKQQAESAGFLAGMSANDVIEKVIQPLQAKALEGLQKRMFSDALELLRRYRVVKKQGDADASKLPKAVEALRALYGLMDRAAATLAASTAKPEVTAEQFGRLLAELSHSVLDGERRETWSAITDAATFKSKVRTFGEFRTFFIAGN